jgi:hypothetical protein
MKLSKNPWLGIFLTIFLSFGLYPLMAQDIPELKEFNSIRVDYNQKGMLILGSWAIGNLIWGGVGVSNTSGETKAFHQMNMYWNTVNLAIAGFGYWQASKELPGTDFWTTMEAQQGIEKILLVNAGLDLAYLAGGMYLKERGIRKSNERLIGFGKSVILQGAFLLVFDGVMYGFHNSHSKEIKKITQNISLGPQGFKLILPITRARE